MNARLEKFTVNSSLNLPEALEWRRVSLITLSYFIASQIGYIFASHGLLTPVWPPAAIGLAVALLYGPRALIGVVLLLWADYLFHAPLTAAAFLASAIQPFALLVAATITPMIARRMHFDPGLTRIGDALLLVALSLVYPAISTLINAYGLCYFAGDPQCREIGGPQYFTQYALADTLGLWICLAAMLSWILRLDSVTRIRLNRPQDYLPESLSAELMQLVFVVIAIPVGLTSYWLTHVIHLPVQIVSFMIIPLLIWAALSFQPLFVHTAIMLSGLLGVSLQFDLNQAANGDMVVHLATLLLGILSISLLTLLVGIAMQNQRLLAKTLIWQASHDALTGLCNRAEMERELSLLVTAAQNSGEEHAFCYVDLDKFQIVNDSCGHMAGDRLLRELGTFLLGMTRQQDTLARLGGDEFGILLRDVNVSQAVAIAEDYCDAIEHFRFEWEGKRFSIDASAGVAPINRDSDFSHPVAAADTACTLAKQGGSHRVVQYTADNEELRLHRTMLAWVPKIRQALAEDRLCLYCQIIEPLRGHEDALHFEVLVRIRDEHGKLVPPGEFIPAAEHFGLMPSLDLWVVRETLAWLERWPVLWSMVGHCGINISGASIGETDFRRAFTALITHPGIPLDKLCFEITETAAISHMDQAAEFVRALRRLGARTALDDFGVGLSSFGYLKKLPVDFVKIDGSFVKSILDNPVDDAMVRSIHQVAKAMGVASIAEYVEDGRIVERLMQIGIDFGQGWHFGQPVPIEQFFALAMEGVGVEGLG